MTLAAVDVLTPTQTKSQPISLVVGTDNNPSNGQADLLLLEKYNYDLFFLKPDEKQNPVEMIGNLINAFQEYINTHNPEDKAQLKYAWSLYAILTAWENKRDIFRFTPNPFVLAALKLMDIDLSTKEIFDDLIIPQKISEPPAPVPVKDESSYSPTSKEWEDITRQTLKNGNTEPTQDITDLSTLVVQAFDKLKGRHAQEIAPRSSTLYPEENAIKDNLVFSLATTTPAGNGKDGYLLRGIPDANLPKARDFCHKMETLLSERIKNAIKHPA